MAKPRLGRQFYDVPGEDLATALLGQTIVRMVNKTRLSARIVETEAYLGAVDKAAHSFKGPTDRNQAMFMQPGTAYVYSIYGMHYCINISSRGAGCAVLIRSVEPLEGVEMMGELRKMKKKSSTSTSSPAATASFKVHQLTNGPAKLCQALSISKQQLNQHDLVTDTEMWLEEGGGVSSDCVVMSARINIAYAEEWTDKPLRFYVLHNPCVSVRNKPAEKLLEGSTGLKNTATEKAKVTSTQTAKFASTGKAKVTSTQTAKFASTEKAKVTPSQTAETASMGKAKVTPSQTAETASMGKAKVTPSQTAETAFMRKAKVTPSQTAETASMQKAKVTPSQTAETASMQKAKVTPSQTAETASMQKAKVTPSQTAETASMQKAKVTPSQTAEPASMQKAKATSSKKQGFTVKAANNSAVHSKLGRRKVKASSVGGDQTETAVVPAKSAKKEEGTTCSPYFSKT